MSVHQRKCHKCGRVVENKDLCICDSATAIEHEKLNALHEQVIADAKTIKKMQCEIDRSHVANGVEHERFLLTLQDVQNRDFEITQLIASLSALVKAAGAYQASRCVETYKQLNAAITAAKELGCWLK